MLSQEERLPKGTVAFTVRVDQKKCSDISLGLLLALAAETTENRDFLPPKDSWKT